MSWKRGKRRKMKGEMLLGRSEKRGEEVRSKHVRMVAVVGVGKRR